MEIEYREIKESKIKPVYSATPDKPVPPFRLHLIPKTKQKSKNEAYVESWKL